MSGDESYASKLAAIRSAVGPSPWYWQTFPQIDGASGTKYDWTFHGTKGDNAYLVTLARSGASESPIMALTDTHVRPFLVPPHCFALWYPHQDQLNVRCFDPEKLAAFALSSLPPKFKRSGKYYCIQGDTIAKARIDMGLAPGRNPLDVPDLLSGLDETIMVAGNPEWDGSGLGCSVYDVSWKDRRVDVYPQYWFNHGSYDFMYQGITRVTRDPQSGRFIGDGIRIGSFELTEDGCHLERWLKSA